MSLTLIVLSMHKNTQTVFLELGYTSLKQYTVEYTVVIIIIITDNELVQGKETWSWFTPEK